MQALKKENLTLEQKLGMTLCANLAFGEEDFENALEMIKDHRLGGVWIQDSPHLDEYVRRIREVADYPVVVICDAEQGAGENLIPQQLAITAAGAKDEDAYSFGYATGAWLRQHGYNAVTNPVVDVCLLNTPCGHTTRTYGDDYDTVSRLSIATARGMRDAGILVVAKHYPGGCVMPYDTHMREDISYATAEEMKATHMRPYFDLLEAGLLDGVMPGHRRFMNIDPEYPTCLSRPVLSMLREAGFDGFYISDALCMMGVVLKYGMEDPIGLCLAAGCDMPLPWEIPIKKCFDAALACYEKGLVTEEQIDECLDRILLTQERILALPEPSAVIPEEHVERVARMHTASIAAVCEEGLSPSISRDGRHLFIMVTDGSTELAPDQYFPGPQDWFHPPVIAEKIKELFPNSDAIAMQTYPATRSIINAFSTQVPYEDVVFITYGVTSAYIGPECMTSRIVSFMDALQSTDRIAAHLYFGNPFVATDAPYVPRILMGYISEKSVEHALRILAGEATPEGQIPYKNLAFHKKGDVLFLK